MEELLKQLVEYLKAISPQLWEILLKQSHSEAVAGLVVGFIFLVILVFCLLRIFVLYKRNSDQASDCFSDDYSTQYWLLGIVAAVFGMPCIFLLTLAFQRLYNPEYYAIQSILTLLKGQ